MDKKNILLIISQYDPAFTPNVFRWKSIIQEFQKRNHNITILTTKSAGKETDYVENGVRIVRTGYNTLMDAFQYLTNVKRKRNEIGNVSGKKSVLRLCAEKILDFTWRKIYWPDGSAIWYVPAVRKAKNLISTENYDAVISVGLPFTAHLVGLSCKKNNTHLKWLMDIEDPFCYSDIFWVNNFAFYKNLNIRKEKECFRYADGISLTNEAAVKQYLNYFKFAKSKISVIPPLLNEFPAVDSHSVEVNPEKYNFGYFGSFYHKVREPYRLIDFLTNLKKVDTILFSKTKVYLACQLNPIHEAYFQKIDPQIKEKLEFLGFLGQQKTQIWMLKMDILINIGNSTEYHLPSKIIDYLAANRPILNLTSNENDSVKHFIGQKDFFHISDKFTDIEILKGLDYIKKSKTKAFHHNFILDQYSPSSIANKYLDLLKK